MTAALQTSDVWVLLSKANSNINPPRALWVGTAGTANLMQKNGTTRANFPLHAGLVPISILQLRTGGTADDIWGLY